MFHLYRAPLTSSWPPDVSRATCRLRADDVARHEAPQRERRAIEATR